MSRKDIPEGLLTAADVASRLGVSSTTIYVAAARGDLPYSRYGKYVRFAPDDVAKLDRDRPWAKAEPVLADLPQTARVLYALRDIAPDDAVAGVTPEALAAVLYPSGLKGDDLHRLVHWPLRDLQALGLADNDLGPDGGEPRRNARGHRVGAFWRATERGMVESVPRQYAIPAGNPKAPPAGPPVPR